MRHSILVLLAFLIFCCFKAASADTSTDGQLIVFSYFSGDEQIDQFQARLLEHLKVEAAEAGVADFSVFNSRYGAPPEVNFTPCLVFRNSLGYSIFHGDPATTGTVARFIRTARMAPIPNSSPQPSSVPGMKLSRAWIATPLEIAAPDGTLPEEVSTDDFLRGARQAFAAGLNVTPHSDGSTPADRSFYTALQPIVTTDGQLQLWLRLSESPLGIGPILELDGEQLADSWGNRAELFTRAGQLARSRIEQFLSTAPNGWRPVDESVETIPWEQLMGPIPDNSGPESNRGSVPALPTIWTLDAPHPDAPHRLHFDFWHPIEGYGGSAADMSGRLHLADNDSLTSANGYLEVRTGSISMQGTDLEESVKQYMLEVADFPTARFDLTGILGQPEPLVYGKPSRIKANGVFRMLGKQQPVEVAAELTPWIGKNGQAELAVSASFTIRLKQSFGLDGPDGPSTASDRVRVELDFTMLPEGQ